MEQGSGSGIIDKSRVLDVKPLRCLAPVFPNSPGMSSISNPSPTSFVCVPPTGPFPPGVQPFYPFLAPNDAQNHPGNFYFETNDVPAPVPLNSYRTPIPRAKGKVGRPRKYNKTRTSEPMVVEDEEYTENQSDHADDGFNAEAGSGSGSRRGRPRKRSAENGVEFNVDSFVDGFLISYKLNELDDFRRANGDRDIVGTIIFVYNLLRRRLTQLEEAKALPPGIARRPDLKSASLFMTKGIRTNITKRIGPVPGIEIGDIFFYRMELCLVGLHAPSMSGIDYTGVRGTMDEEPVAVSIVSSGGYDDDDGVDSDVLVYSGQGGVQRRDGQMFDQKLERGNLALEKSLHRANEVRVIRGVKDIINPPNKIYVYDGLYKIQESWAEKNKSGCTVFKYKLVRVPGQPEAFSLWKSIQQWRDGTGTRNGLILPDLTSGVETQPVTLVNDVDNEKGPTHFTYISTLKHSKPFSTSKTNLGCACLGGCQPGDSHCPCNQKNEGHVPYSSLGVLMSHQAPIHECGPSCACPLTCRNRISQAGIRVRLEVFKTRTKGWGLRSWDPIRAGSFICEYAGDVVNGDLGNGSDDSFIFDATRYYDSLEAVRDDSTDSGKSSFPLVISAMNNGNVARFMNHSCSPNVFWLPVLRESNGEAYLHVAFFAIRHIPPMQELTFNYGVVSHGNGDEGKKKCFCGSVKCRGYFY